MLEDHAADGEQTAGFAPADETLGRGTERNPRNGAAEAVRFPRRGGQRRKPDGCGARGGRRNGRLGRLSPDATARRGPAPSAGSTPDAVEYHPGDLFGVVGHR
ncbi:hypothetical protein GCM10010247_37260 [Streptomyces calvus]|nr:hypothetical protein GCM10010247_37260 [Streptomyces calvus]